MTHYDIVGWLASSLESYVPIKKGLECHSGTNFPKGGSIDTPRNSMTCTRDLYFE